MHNGNKFEREPLTVSTCDILIPLIDVAAYATECHRHSAVLALAVRGAWQNIKSRMQKEGTPPKKKIFKDKFKKNAPPKREDKKKKTRTRAQKVELW
jgi:hypothetical protein